MEEGRGEFNILQVNLQERELEEDLGIDGRTILEWTLKELDINTRNWVDSDQDRDYWRNPMNVAFNFRVS